MGEPIMCDVYCVADSGRQGNNAIAIIQINRAANPKAIETVTIPKGHRKILFYEGDVVQCLQGHIYVHVKPGTRATGFHLKQQVGEVLDGMRTDTAVMSIEMTRAIARGTIHVKKDIGNIQRGTGASIR